MFVPVSPLQGVCYVTHPSYIPEARREWEKRTNNSIVDYAVVPRLPKDALLEWQVWAHIGNSRFECKFLVFCYVLIARGKTMESQMKP